MQILSFCSSKNIANMIVPEDQDEEKEEKSPDKSPDHSKDKESSSSSVWGTRSLHPIHRERSRRARTQQSRKTRRMLRRQVRSTAAAAGRRPKGASRVLSGKAARRASRTTRSNATIRECSATPDTRVSTRSRSYFRWAWTRTREMRMGTLR